MLSGIQFLPLRIQAIPQTPCGIRILIIITAGIYFLRD